MTTIRNELPVDIPQVRLVNELAFGQPAEADVVDRLRQTCPDALSLVAEVDGDVVGQPGRDLLLRDSSGGKPRVQNLKLVLKS